MKKTKKEMFNEMLSINKIASNDEMVAFINHEIELLNKKSGSKTNAKQIANIGVKNEIVKILTANENAMTITEIIKSMETEYSNQKISALMKQLVESGKVVRIMEKKVARFSLSA